ncbi:hypothetical protein BU26DRAFT_247277 [Trematosphaeria pertusa]|uniref:Uncharacterized protein n=1 Tax=Trematosphaeria pertusa TaxID=390896 RepID=A0A6A6IQX8_9PLEO|nr:uncharacterized protein BU26DRAFT_247277 [Trematosphaeria pertusa]KAF2251933.1 hypothetical protein BU26DRAFT_247277 [Trematosphaeria pertusa]
MAGRKPKLSSTRLRCQMPPISWIHSLSHALPRSSEISIPSLPCRYFRGHLGAAGLLFPSRKPSGTHNRCYYTFAPVLSSRMMGGSSGPYMPRSVGRADIELIGEERSAPVFTSVAGSFTRRLVSRAGKQSCYNGALNLRGWRETQKEIVNMLSTCSLRFCSCSCRCRCRCERPTQWTSSKAPSQKKNHGSMDGQEPMDCSK